MATGHFVITGTFSYNNVATRDKDMVVRENPLDQDLVSLLKNMIMRYKLRILREQYVDMYAS